MKLIILNPKIFENHSKYFLNLQKMQLPAHVPYPYWTKNYEIESEQILAIPENIFACLTGQTQGIMGSQYNLSNLFQVVQKQVVPDKLNFFPSISELEGRKVLCVLAHASFGLSDLLLAMPFLKIFAESLNLQLSISVNSAGLNLFKEQKWLYKIYPEIINYTDLRKYDYYLESSVEKMDVLAWIRNYLLKQIGEKVFYNRFPCPEIQATPENRINNLPKRNLQKKICLLNWETSSQKRSLPVEILKAIFKSLIIMDYQILISKSKERKSGIFDWLEAQGNVIEASNFISEPIDLLNLVAYADLVISPDTNLIHFAGALRKRALCIFMKGSNEIYKKAWLRGAYWPGKIDKLYPTVKNIWLPHNTFKSLEEIVYKSIREAAFVEDPEMIEMYNSLFSNLRRQNLFQDLEAILQKKNIVYSLKTS